MKNQFLKIRNLERSNEVFVYLIAFVLLAIPLKNIVGSISLILFITVAFAKFRRDNFTFSKSLFLPILFYVLMILSLLWTRDFALSVAGLQKELPFLLVPLAFLTMPKLGLEQRNKIIEIFSYGMVCYSLIYLTKAAFKFIDTRDFNVFFYHELVSLEVNAIYISVFTSFALFYFINLKNKTDFTRVIIGFLAIMVFLLSSKSIIFIDFDA